MRLTRNVRLTGLAAALTATAVLLTGCGGGTDTSGDGDGDKKTTQRVDGGDKGDGTSPEPGRTHVDEDKSASTRLTPEQTIAVLPRADDLVDWSLTTRPFAQDLKKKAPKCTGAFAWCKGALQSSTAFFTHQDAGHIEFTVYAYDSGAAADAAYRLVMEDLTDRELNPESVTEVPLATRVGDAALAKKGTTRLTSPGSLLVSRVGTTVVTVRTGGLATMAKSYSPRELTALGTLIADRSRQVQKGGAATLELPDDALTIEKRKN
ncbi:hypothetical protein [Streptomyces sp. NPDC058953]|uniref:hypothetical protein n=1 Tax=unclassified Streptomyces TaxID=2593676 RepID=UPI0036957537